MINSTMRLVLILLEPSTCTNATVIKSKTACARIASTSQRMLSRRKTCSTMTESATCTGMAHKRSQALNNGSQTGSALMALICWTTCACVAAGKELRLILDKTTTFTSVSQLSPPTNSIDDNP